jgi:hypothetical protein
VSQSRRLKVIPDQKDLFALQHAAQKMVFGGELGAEFLGRIG